MSKNYGRYQNDRTGRYESDEEEELVTSKNQKNSNKIKTAGGALNINAALQRALADAANPGEGDEEPEVLPPPSAEETGISTIDINRFTAEEHPEISAQIKALPRPSSATSSAKSPSKATTIPVVEREDGEVVEGEGEAMDDQEIETESLALAQQSPLSLQYMVERAKYIPLRLTYEERKALRLVCAAINVSDYTTAIDIPFKHKARRHHAQLQYIVAFLTALIASENYQNGQQFLEDRNLQAYEPFLQTILEIARRYKITNPEKLRSEYGKLIYLMQDSVSETVQPLLTISIHQKIRTVSDLLLSYPPSGPALLEDPLIEIATQEILPDKNKSRATIQQEIRKKEKAINYLVKKYARSGLTEEMIQLCLYSITDNNSFLNSNCQPVVDCIQLLQEYFSPTRVEEGYNLGIQEGKNGSRLSHNHELQYYYVLQSLTLWSVILKDMFRLWYLAEDDLLNANCNYELKETGQGLQRIQKSPRVYAAMHEILYFVQQEIFSVSNNANSSTAAGGGGGGGGGRTWVGTSVVHLGDHNVPNALVFIDKYTQVSRILGPLITTLKNLENLFEENEGVRQYLQSYGTIDQIKKDILYDFFTHAFDGSGGDNFFDAGSCIDGRLTSAWNWCSQLSSKPYYPLFKLTGFLSFDGQFER